MYLQSRLCDLRVSVSQPQAGLLMAAWCEYQDIKGGEEAGLSQGQELDGALLLSVHQVPELKPGRASYLHFHQLTC